MATFQDRINLLYQEARYRNYKVGRKAFAEQLGISLGRVSAWLDGNGRPDFELLKEVAKNAGVSVSWLLGETDFRSLVIPETANNLPPEAQEEYKFLISCIKQKYNVD